MMDSGFLTRDAHGIRLSPAASMNTKSRSPFVQLALAALFLLVSKSALGDVTSVKIGLIGDSTVASTYGWGPAFALAVKDHVKVLNYAANGQTLQSLSGKMDELVREKPDYILIQFGHNDMKVDDTDVYRKRLVDYVRMAKHGGCKVVILSSVTRREFGEDGTISPRIIHGRTLSDYSKAARTVAHETGTPFIDLHAISVRHHNSIGKAESSTYNFEERDTTHFSEKGAREIAGLIIRAIKTDLPELAECLR